MPVRYYPKFYVIENLQALDDEFVDVQGTPYEGRYYATLNGRFFSGPNPQVGPNEELFALNRTEDINNPNAFVGIKRRPITYNTGEFVDLAERTSNVKPTFFYPKPNEEDYRRGYIIRYFTKKENERNGVIEISYNEYVDITNGTAVYDISIYQTTKILWKLTGPLRSQRKSQYNIIPGIIDTNQRLTEEANKTFLGIVDFIGGQYDKFARPTP